MEAVRVFIAVPVDIKTLRRVSDLQETLKKIDAGIRWVNPKNLHLTLLFLGDVMEDRLPDYYRVLERCALKVPNFHLSFQGLGSFPDVKRPRVLWVGVKKGKDEMTQLAQFIKISLWKAGFLEEKEVKQKYSPHLTIGRVKSRKNLPELIQQVEEHKDFCTGPQKISEMQFMKSQLTRSGPIYTVVKKINLKNFSESNKGQPG